MPLQSIRGGTRILSWNWSMRRVVQVGTWNRSNGNTQPFQQDRVYDVSGDNLLPALSAQLDGLLILEIEYVRDGRTAMRD